jgi:dTDP-4-dehydrorhamnose 3,5-epimerase
MTHPTPLPGTPDVQTVTAAGRAVAPQIDGVITRRPPVHVDHRGSLHELYNGAPDLGPEPVVHVYQTSLRPGQIKGWARHEHKVDRYTIAVGEMLALLYDARAGSPTEGVLQRIALSPRGTMQIRIPVGVWHLLVNLSPDETHFINMPTQAYVYETPDRILLPWDTDELPVDVREYLPKF